jgi:serine protease
LIAVGASTEGGCVANYSDRGEGLALVAPGGRGETGTPCHTADRPIFQLTLIRPGAHAFGFPSDYVGTSMSAAHVSGVAAMVIASGVLGPTASPARITCQLEATARTTDLGEPYLTANFGAGLLDAGRAVGAPAPGC